MFLTILNINFTALWDLTPCNIYLLIRGTHCLHVRSVPYCTLNAEGVRFSETSVNMYQVLRRHIPYNHNLRIRVTDS